jgi:protein SCO1/2
MTNGLLLIVRRGRQMRATVVAASMTLAVLAGPAAGRAWAQFTGPLSVPPPGTVASARIPILKDVGIDQKIGATVPLSLPFTDESGRDVTLGQYFGKRPVVLALVYYQCPMLCTEVLNGLTASMETLTFDAGKDFDVVVVSFDPTETPALAAAKKQTYMDRYRRPGAAAGMHFLTGRPDAIHALTSAVGFRYAYDQQLGQFAHPAVITILTPTGQVSRYLLGIEYAPRDVRLALVEAGEGKLGTVVDQALLYCYHYDPTTGKYGLVIFGLVRLGGVLTVGALGTFIVLALRRERRQAAAAGAGRSSSTGVR